MRAADFTRPGAWQGLLACALTLTDHLQTVVCNPTWSFGGGTVLMLRLNHRQSKDISWMRAQSTLSPSRLETHRQSDTDLRTKHKT